MTSWVSQRGAALFLVCLLAGLSCAEPPPEALDKLLQSEPITTTSWKVWRDRLKDWSGEHFAAAAPAFAKAYEFVKSQRKGDTLPKTLNNDAVAYLVLGLGILDDKAVKPTAFSRAREAEKWLYKSVLSDKELARAHYAMGQVIRQQELASPKEGGPIKPAVRRFQDALDYFDKARKLDPRLPMPPASEMAELALKADKLEEAEYYLQQVLKEQPDDVATARLLAKAITGQAGHRRDPGSKAIQPLVEKFPEDGELRARLGLALLHDRQPDEAVEQIEKARSLKTDPKSVIKTEEVRQIDEYRDRKRKEATEKTREEERKKAEETRRRQEAEARERTQKAPMQFLQSVGWWVLIFTLVYGPLMGLMCLAGLWLAKRTRGPHAADMLGDSNLSLVAAGGHVTRTRHETWLEKFYLVSLLAALVMFYLSLPFIFLGLLLVFVFLLVIALFIRRDNQAAGVHSAMLRASGGGMTAVFKAMFARTGRGGYGLLKTHHDCPMLYEAVKEVAAQVDTEPVDELWISPGADFGVHQEGYGPFGMFGSRKRVLTLGLCVMHYLDVSELKAILAHEYAHFSHADTFWNRFLFQVTLSLRVAMREMARSGGWLTWVNPFYWFFYLYSKSYTLLSAGFSRSREFLADRMACSLYGSDVFTRGLIKVCTDGSLFEQTIYSNIVRLLKQKKAFVNMYLAFREFRETAYTEEDRRKMYRKMLDEKESIFSTHPTFKERVNQAKQLPVAKKTAPVSSLQLFDDPEAMERELTDFLTSVVSEAMN